LSAAAFFHRAVHEFAIDGSIQRVKPLLTEAAEGPQGVMLLAFTSMVRSERSVGRHHRISNRSERPIVVG
jgi:hypothetical protein